MLFRCMMILLLLTISMMPVWAEEKDMPPFEISENYQCLWDHIQDRTGYLYDPIDSNTPHDPYKDTPYTEDGYYKYNSSLLIKMDTSACSKIRVTAEEWIDDGVYYVRYTFTNPTDEPFEKDVDHISAVYDLYAAEKDIVTKCQRSNAIRKLSLSPHSARSFIVSLPLQEEASFSYLKESRFYFTDHTMIDYIRTADILPKVMMAPIISSSGEPYLVMKNHHYFKTITDIRNIHTRFAFYDPHDKVNGETIERYYVERSPLPIRLKPQETISLPLPRSAVDVPEDWQGIFSQTTVMIDGVRHAFDVSMIGTEYLSLTPNFTSRLYNREDTWYFTPSIFDEHNLVEATGTYEISGSVLDGYLRIKNPHSRILSIHGVHISANLEYYTADNNRQCYRYHCFYPYRFNLSPGEEEFVKFSLTVPEDAATLPRLDKMNLCSVTDHQLASSKEDQSVSSGERQRHLNFMERYTTRYLNYRVNLTYQKIPPLQKALYQPTINPRLY